MPKSKTNKQPKAAAPYQPPGSVPGTKAFEKGIRREAQDVIAGLGSGFKAIEESLRLLDPEPPTLAAQILPVTATMAFKALVRGGRLRSATALIRQRKRDLPLDDLMHAMQLVPQTCGPLDEGELVAMVDAAATLAVDLQGEADAHRRFLAQRVAFLALEVLSSASASPLQTRQKAHHHC